MEKNNDMEYFTITENIENGILTKYKGDHKYVRIPEGVTEIDDYAFYKCKNLEDVIIPESVTKIGYFAFANCNIENLDYPQIKIKDGIAYSPDGKDLLHLVKYDKTKIIVPKGTENICIGAFNWCEDIESITLPDGIKKIENGAFFYCSKLASINFPDSIEIIENGAFLDCENLDYINLPKNLKVINKTAFSGCKLTNLIIPGNISTLCEEAFLFSRIKTLKICEGVERIEEKAFSSCKELSKVELPKSLKYIGENAFASTMIESLNHPLIHIENGCHLSDDGKTVLLCMDKEEITIPDGVTKIADSAFENCRKLVTVHIPDSVKEIGSQAFAHCNIKNLNHPAIKIINGCALSNDGKEFLYSTAYPITQLEIPEGVTKINHGAFSNNEKIISVSIPSTVEEIGGYAFSGCINLKEISLPKNLNKIGKKAFADCDIENFEHPHLKIKNGIALTSDGKKILYCAKNSMTDLIIPDGVEAFGRKFKEQTKWQTIHIPGSVKRIEDKAFYGCSEITKVTMDSGVKEIGYKAFSNCYSLSEISIPDSVESICEKAFLECVNLEITNLSASVVNIGNNAFSGTHISNLNHPKIKIKNGLALQSDEKKVLYIADYRLTEIQIPEGVEEICENAFADCKLKKITFPSTLKKIGAYAFVSCALEKVTLPNGLTHIGEGAFYLNINLTEVHIPESVEVIENDAFAFCQIEELEHEKLVIKNGCALSKDLETVIYCANAKKRNISFPDGIKKIASNSFAFSELNSSPKITSISFPDSLREIDCYAFDGLSRITEITIPGFVKKIETHAFTNCHELTRFVVEEGVEEIEENPIEFCSELKSISLPKSAKIVEPKKHCESRCSKRFSPIIEEMAKYEDEDSREDLSDFEVASILGSGPGSFID